MDHGFFVFFCLGSALKLVFCFFFVCRASLIIAMQLLLDRVGFSYEATVVLVEIVTVCLKVVLLDLPIDSVFYSNRVLSWFMMEISDVA